MSLLREAERCIANQGTYKALNAFISPFRGESSALAAVKDADGRLSAGTTKSPLDGKLVAIKDNICTAQYPTTCASAILKHFTSPFDATVVSKLAGAGAIISGKTNLDEFGMGSHSTHSFFGPVTNKTAGLAGAASAGGSSGGSSGGSAVAVATGQCYAALGTDTGGSVRLPAAYTGIVGFKPSYGLVSRWGVVAYANSLDTVGVLAKDSRSARAVFDIIQGFDQQDPTSLKTSARSRIQQMIDKSSRQGPLRIGVPAEYNIEELSPLVRETWIRTLKHLQEEGHSIQPVSLPSTKHALSAYYVLAPAEASSNLAKYDGVRYGTRESQNDSAGGTLFAKTRGEGFGDEVKRRIMLGSYSLSAQAIDNYFLKAQKVRRLVQQDFDSAFALSNPLLPSHKQSSRSDGVDVIICPTAPSLPPASESLKTQTPLDAYMNDVFTVPASFAGLPAISVPVAHNVESGAPLDTTGVQIIAQYGDDNVVFKVAEVIEEWQSIAKDTPGQA
ncbi:MAG: hypothetical protein M1819_005684 [Sarea resinae]|nr:MAG: hypothetical protein M1819_005684 [Sarea resinae]